jgi:hypothetical protein
MRRLAAGALAPAIASNVVALNEFYIFVIILVVPAVTFSLIFCKR